MFGPSPHLSARVEACPSTMHPTAQQYVSSHSPVGSDLCAADGSISYGEGPRSIPANESLFTGAWHMVTVTSQPGTPGAVKGYRLYLDGRLVNQLSDGTSYYAPGGLSIPVRRRQRRGVCGVYVVDGQPCKSGAFAAKRFAPRPFSPDPCGPCFLSTKSTAVRTDIPSPLL